MCTSLLLLLAPLLAAPLAAQQSVPEGTPIPRSMTPREAALWNSGYGLRGTGTLPPEGALYCPPEYAPMDGILIAWEGSTSWKNILGRMCGQITTTGNADVYCAVDAVSEISGATSVMQSFGTNMARVEFVVGQTDTIWIRDYGPRYIYQGDVRVIVDHHYNRPRPFDDGFPSIFASHKGHTRYHNDVIHGGGNFHLDALGEGYATELMVNENPSKSVPQLLDIYKDFQNLDLTILDALPTSIDSTQHLDMWMQIIADDAVVISDWPTQSGTIQDQICDQAALDMAAKGYTVHRIPAVHSGGTHYTFTNVVMCNDLVMIPSYTNSTAATHNATALGVWQAALPGKTIVQIPSQDIVTAAGVLHCIVMHVPAHRGGSDPTAYLYAPLDGSILAPGALQALEWAADDDEAPFQFDLEWSDDGGASWTPITVGLPGWTRLTYWSAPSAATNEGQLRLTVRDAQGNTGSHVAQVAIAAPSDAAWTRWGYGKAGTLGVPELSLSAAPVSGSTVAVELDLAKLLRGETRARELYAGTFAWTVPGVLTDLPVDALGHAALSVSVPSNAGLLGREFYLQAWVPNDPVAGGLAASNAVTARVGL